MLKLLVTADSLRLIAIDIDGTLLNPEFQISETDLSTLRHAHAQGIEVILDVREVAFAAEVAIECARTNQLHLVDQAPPCGSRPAAE